MRITFKDGLYVAEFSRDRSQWRGDKNAAKAAGFRTAGGPEWVWSTPSADVVLSLKGHPGLFVSKEAHEALTAAETQIVNSIAASRATDADIEIPVPQGINPSTGEPFAYLPYQKAGIFYASQRENILISDEMGLGKSIQTVGVANLDNTVHRVLIVCPSSIKLNWKKEWLRWDVKHLSVGVVAAGKKTFPESDVVIINYDLLGKFQLELRAVEWDLLAIDECHYLKEGKTGRTQEVYGRKKTRKSKRTRTVKTEKEITKSDGTTEIQIEKKLEKYEIEVAPLAPLKARRRVFLTGTPIVNRPKEMWPLVQSLDPNGLGGNWKRYAERYCNGQSTRFGYDWAGSSNLPELQSRLRSRFMIRRLKRDVLKELPPKRRQVVALEANSEALLKIIEKEKRTYEQYEEALKSGEFSFETPAFSEISRVRKETAVAKVPYVVDYLKGMLEDGDQKIVVMAHHYEVVDAIIDALRTFGVVSIDGRTKNQDRQAAVDAFQSDSKVRVFVGTIKAAGVGLTLTASSTVVFAELDWVPGNVTQAEDRTHRIGQRNHVMIYHLVLENSLDERMVEIIIEKQKVMDKALDIETQNEALPLPEISDEPEPEVIHVVKPKHGLKFRKDTEQTAEVATQSRQTTPVSLRDLSPYTPEQTNAIHQILKMIAGMCDGAAAVDGHGFNKMDTNFGKSLAGASHLTPKMAMAAFNLVRKYQRQVPEALLLMAGIQPKKKLDTGEAA